MITSDGIMAVKNTGDLSRAGLQSFRYLSFEICSHPMVLCPFGVVRKIYNNVLTPQKVPESDLLHPVYDHAPNALVPLPSTAVGNIKDDEWHPAGREGPEGGWHDAPPLRR